KWKRPCAMGKSTKLNSRQIPIRWKSRFCRTTKDTFRSCWPSTTAVFPHPWCRSLTSSFVTSRNRVVDKSAPLRRPDLFHDDADDPRAGRHIVVGGAVGDRIGAVKAGVGFVVHLVAGHRLAGAGLGTAGIGCARR